MSLDIKNFNIEIYLDSTECKDKVVIPNLSHGSNIVEIITGDEDLKDCDAIFTKSNKFKLGIKTADCSSVCYGDGKIIGIAHIGWRGLCTNLNDKMLEKFNSSNLSIFIAPFMHKFEIQKDFCYDKLKEKFDEIFFEYYDNKIFFNFKDALLSIMPEKGVVVDERNTFKDLSLPSHRRNKIHSRLLTVISFK